MSLQELIDNALAKKGERIRSHKYSPSMLGRCYRSQFFNRKEEPVSNPPDVRTERVFQAGKLFHNFVQDLIIANNPEAQEEVLIETADFKGYADLVLPDEVTDIKSQHSKAFWYRKDLTWKELEPKLYPNILQVVFYAVELHKERARLVFISKDDLSIQEYPILTDNYRVKLAKEISTLRDFWREEKLPPAEPRAYPNKDGKFAECGYCLWETLCTTLEKPKDLL